MRNRLVDAAIEVLRRQGPAEVTTRAVLRQAGLSAGALYHYFESKDELFEAIAGRFVDDDPAMPASDEIAAGDIVDVHVAILRSLFARDAWSILPQLRIAALANEPMRATIGRYDRQLIERTGALNRRAQDAGVFVQDLDGDALAEVVETFYEGFVLKDQAGEFATSRSRVVGLFLELLASRVVEPGTDAAAVLRRSFEEITHP